MYRSFLAGLAPPIPYKLIPDVRPLLLFGTTAAIAGFAAFGPGRRRGFLVAYLLALHGAFAFEVSTIHWFAPIPGPIGGSRADPVRLLAALSGLGCALLLHARVHAEATRADAVARGVPVAESAVTAQALERAAKRSIAFAAGGAIAVGLLVEATAAATGDEGSIPLPIALALGAAVLAAVGLAVGAVRSRTA